MTGALETAGEERPRSFAGAVTGSRGADGALVGVTMVAGDAYMFRGINFAVGQPYNLPSAKDANRSPFLLARLGTRGRPDRGLRQHDRTVSPRLPLRSSRHWTDVALGRDSSDPRIWTLLRERTRN